MTVPEVAAPGGSREGWKEPPSSSGNDADQKAVTSPSPQRQNSLNREHHPRSPQEQPSSAPEGQQPPSKAQLQPQPRTGHGPSAISKLLAVVLAPLIDVLFSIYHRILSPTTPSPDAPPPPSSSPPRAHQHQEDAAMKPRAAKSRAGRKENVRPGLVAKVANLTVREDPALLPLPRGTILPFLPVHKVSISPKEIEGEDPSLKVERKMHREFIEQALEMARLALKTNETPVGCVLVCDGRVIAKGMNATNITRNGTRHAEFMALSSLFSYIAGADEPQDALQPITNVAKNKSYYRCNGNLNLEDDAVWDAVDPTLCYFYPYGQKLHPAPRVYESIISECTLYVTVEPCVMCASMLRQLGIKRVFFGAVNDKFGGTGGVFRIHLNSPPACGKVEPLRRVMDGKIIRIARDGSRTTLKPVFEEVEETEGDDVKDQAGEQAVEQAREQAGNLVDTYIAKRAGKHAGKHVGRQAKDRIGEQTGPPQECVLMGMSGTDRHNMWAVNTEPVEGPLKGGMRRNGDGGNVEPGYLAEGGWGRDEAVALLRQFYVQENGRAPVPRKKEGRAARLAAMLERDGMDPTIDLLGTAPESKSVSAPATTASTPMPLAQLGDDSSNVLGMIGNNSQMMTHDADSGQESDSEGGSVGVPTPMSDVT